jgi:hypothetical protein
VENPEQVVILRYILKARRGEVVWRATYETLDISEGESISDKPESYTAYACIEEILNEDTG